MSLRWLCKLPSCLLMAEQQPGTWRWVAAAPQRKRQLHNHAETQSCFLHNLHRAAALRALHGSGTELEQNLLTGRWLPSSCPAGPWPVPFRAPQARPPVLGWTGDKLWVSTGLHGDSRQPAAAVGKPWETVELLPVCLVSRPQSLLWQHTVNTASS